MNERLNDSTMPSTEPEQTIRLREADLSIEKAIAPYRDDVVTVGYTIDSVAEEPRRLRLTDQLPEEIEMDHVGFHPEYDPDSWRVGDERSLVYETVVAPGASRETLYGVRVGPEGDCDAFAVEPTIEVAPAAPEAGENAAADDDGMVFGSDGPDDPSPEPSAGAADDQEMADDDGQLVEAVDGSPAGPDPSRERDSIDSAGALANGAGSTATVDPAGPSDQPAERPEPSDDVPAEALRGSRDTEPSAHGGSLVDGLLDELQRRELSADEQALVRAELGVERTPSEAVRLDHVQATVDDLVAYRDALEGFIDEQGPAQALVEEIRGTLEDHTAELDRLESAVNDLEAAVESLGATQAADVERLEDRLTSVENELSEELTSLDDDLDAVQGELHRLQEWREKLSVAAQLADTGVQSDTTAD